MGTVANKKAIKKLSEKGGGKEPLVVYVEFLGVPETALQKIVINDALNLYVVINSYDSDITNKCLFYDEEHTIPVTNEDIIKNFSNIEIRYNSIYGYRYQYKPVSVVDVSPEATALCFFEISMG